MRKRREAARVSSAALARGVGWHPSKLSRVESGEYPVSDVEVSRYLSWLRVPPEEVDYVLELKAIDERDYGFWLRPAENSVVSPALRSLLYYEATASRSTSYEPLVVPGLLQTREYAAALIRETAVPEEEFERLLQARMDRQEIFRREPRAEFTFFIHEQALRLPVGDPYVMSEQLLHLVFSSSRPNAVIRVVPLSAGAAAVCGGSFRLFEYSKRDRPLVYQSGVVAGLFVDDSEYVGGFCRLVPRLEKVALSEGESLDLLAAMAGDSERPRPQPGPR